jgi:signal transduction histidine kinase/DNA-binding response OmpR family regulator/ligand-binding sensor domain-containing protein
MLQQRIFFIALISVLIFLKPFPSKGEIQNLPFRRISPAGGFTLSPVIEIAEDKQGFIWFVTREKLYQYNSQDFINFEPKYQAGVPHTNNYVTSMLIDRSNTIWVGTNTGVCIFNKHKWQMDAVRIIDREIPQKIIFPTNIKQNEKGEIWMIESNNLALMDSASRELKFVRSKRGRLTVNAFCFDQSNNIYAANHAGDLYHINTKTFEATKINVNLSPIKLFGIYLINNILWVTTDGYGLKRFTREGDFIDSYFTKNKETDFYSNRIRNVLQTSDGKIWIATYKGLIEWKEGNFNQYLSDLNNQFSLPDNSIVALMEDRQKGLWVGTWRGGVGYLNSFANTFETFMHSPFENSVSGNLINSITQASDGMIWIGTDGQGLDILNEQRNIFRHVELKGFKSTSVTNIKCVCHDKQGNIWIGTFGEGLFLKKKGETSFQPFCLENKSVYDILDDERGLWIATYGNGLYYYTQTDQSLQQYPLQLSDTTATISNGLRKIFLDSSKNLWIISTSGIFIKPAGQRLFERVLLDDESAKSAAQVYSISGGKDNLIWVGTDHGIFSIDQSRSIRHYPITFNGKDVSVYGIVSTGPEMLWLSSNFGIFSYNKVTGKGLNYSVSDGLHGNLFIAGAVCQTLSGKIIFGSTTGLVAFNPSTIQANPYKPKIWFSRIYINHKEMLPGQDKSPLEKPLFETEKLRLQPSQNSFSIEFIAQNYLNPQKNQFRYRLTGFEPNWVDAGSNSKATYTNIPPGEYVFEVVACNNDMVWNMEPARLKILIPRPLMLSTLAIIVYVLLIIALGVLVRRIILYRTRLEHQIEIERLQRLEEEKSHQNKLNFFTNISHELRTPLTLITGPVESLMSTPGLDQKSYNQLSLIKRNTGRLLKLINQLLDFRRIEENKMELNVVRADLVVFVREIFNYFVDIARQKNINYVFVTIQDHVPLSFDADKIDKALFNLISNAFKFTPSKGTILVEISLGQKVKAPQNRPENYVIGELKTNNYVQISVEDNGPGIDRASIEKVFDRFFRVESNEVPQSGTGIGLHLTKYLILLHGGEIELRSEVGKGSVFYIRLPLDEPHLNEQDGRDEVEMAHVNHPEHEESFNLDNSGQNSLLTENWNTVDQDHQKLEKLILLVEDNHDLSNFVTQILSDEYRVITAFTGREGIEKAQIYLPDIIISDVMMPDKSGIDLVQELKGNLKTSHIPIILLTALTSVEKKIEGFASGADDYIEKPFNSEVLKARIKNLFASRISLQLYYSKKIALGFDSEMPETPDRKMMEKAIRFVEKNLTDENLDIEMLAGYLNLSQSTLYRKLKALTGKSATDFVRTIRLEYAARMLKEGSHNIEEVSLMVGFNSHSYFSRSFKEHFGKTPSEYVSLN